ncbi:MAG: bifunctional glucose-1-phosphatase/inositol phosphatase [Cardiobacteriaceae bacterium]|nr:bifunctional glucose-1-phosphatase/inositol phosphatase [Cardiobacteriaceae bacterium]
MKKSLLATALIAAAITAQAEPAIPDGYTLEKTVIFSRHGIRAPLIGYGSALAEATPQTWPKWQTEGGQLTPRGAELERLLGQYFDTWFNSTGLIPADSCPGDNILVYTNSLPRTIDTGKNFVAAAFPNCDVKINHLEEVGKMDNTFNPIVRSTVDDAFKAKAEKSIDDMLGDGGFAALNTKMKDDYAVLETVLDYDHSATCEKEKVCDLDKINNTLTFAQGKEPATSGVLRNGTGAADSFILQYYEGFPEKDVAWGHIKTSEDWQKIVDIKNIYHDVLFGSPLLAKETATPLLTFIQNSFSDQGEKHPLIDAARKAKVVLLVGHDSNVGSLLPLLKTAPYELPGQYEKTPISGKVLFEQWRDKNNKQLMRIEYVYQTTDQLRNATPLTADNPPQRVVLHIDGCKTDADGFCPMEDFEKAVTAALKS